MRYKLSENITLAGKLPAGATVTIRVVDLDIDALVTLTTDVCSESGVINGMYRWNTSNITSSITGYKNMYYEMTDGTNTVSGKFIYGGYVDTQSTDISNIPTAAENAQALVDKVI